MVYLIIVSPTPDEEVVPGSLTVSGIVPWHGGPATPVSVQLDQEPAKNAVVDSCTSNPRIGGLCSWSTTVNVPTGRGTHVITATGDEQIAKVTIEVGENTNPIITNTLLTGACIVKSALSLSNPLSSSDPIGLQFSESASGTTVKITSFPAITFPASTVAAGVTIDVIMSLDPASPVLGTFDRVTGTISIPNVILDVSATISYNTGIPIVGTITKSASGTLTVPLTTKSTNSPEDPPIFSDTGAGLGSLGQVLLVGDGTYSTPIFGMTDAGIALTGSIAPSPG